MKKSGQRTQSLRLAAYGLLAGAILTAASPAAFAGGSLDPKDRLPMNAGLEARLKHLTLDDAIDIAVHRNPDILRQLQEIQRTQGVVVEVRAQLLPHLILTGTFQQEDQKLLEGGSGGSTGSSSTGTGGVGTGVGTGNGTTGTATGFPLLRSVDPATGLDAGPVDISKALTSALSGSSFTSPNRNFNVTIEVQQTLYNAGVLPQYRQARFTRDNAYFQLRETVDIVVNNVKTQFYTVLLDEALIKIQEETIRLLESQLRDQQNRFAAGTVPRFDVLQASVAVSNQRPQIITARNNFSLGYIGLARSLGVEYGPDQERVAPIKVIGNLDYHPQNFSAEAGVAAGKAYRALLKQQRQNILIEVEAIRVAAAGYQPVVVGQGGYQVLNSRLSRDITDTINGYFFGANVNWNIFDGLATYGRVKQARALLAQARVVYDDAIRQVVQEVQTNYLALQQNKQLIASQVANVGQAEEAVRLAQARLSAGAGTQLDVLQSQVALTQAQTTELQARYDYSVALGNYERVTGTSTVYAETFDDPLTRKERLTGVPGAPTGTENGQRKQQPGSVKTPGEGARGSGRSARVKINAEHPGPDVNSTLRPDALEPVRHPAPPRPDAPLTGGNQFP